MSQSLKRPRLVAVVAVGSHSVQDAHGTPTSQVFAAVTLTVTCLESSHAVHAVAQPGQLVQASPVAAFSLVTDSALTNFAASWVSQHFPSAQQALSSAQQALLSALQALLSAQQALSLAHGALSSAQHAFVDVDSVGGSSATSDVGVAMTHVANEATSIRLIFDAASMLASPRLIQVFGLIQERISYCQILRLNAPRRGFLGNPHEL